MSRSDCFLISLFVRFLLSLFRRSLVHLTLISATFPSSPPNHHLLLVLDIDDVDHHHHRRTECNLIVVTDMTVFYLTWFLELLI